MIKGFIAITTIFKIILLSIDSVDGTRLFTKRNIDYNRMVLKISAENTTFGGMIEGLGVDKEGNLYSGSFGKVQSAVGMIVPEQKLLYSDTDPSSSSFNAIRFNTNDNGEEEAYISDSVNHRILHLTNRKDNGTFQDVATICQNPGMLEPSDIAIAHTTNRLFMIGKKYTENSVLGDGDLWTCSSNGTTELLGTFYRINAVELSPNEKTLYLSETLIRDANIASTIIIAFDVDPKEGTIKNRRVLVDFEEVDNTASVDVNAIRADNAGNIYVVRKDMGRISKFSPAGSLLAYFDTEHSTNLTSIEFAGPEGKTLYAAGMCAIDKTKGCVVKYEGGTPGRAYYDMVGSGNSAASSDSTTQSTSTSSFEMYGITGLWSPTPSQAESDLETLITPLKKVFDPDTPGPPILHGEETPWFKDLTFTQSPDPESNNDDDESSDENVSSTENVSDSAESQQSPEPTATDQPTPEGTLETATALSANSTTIDEHQKPENITSTDTVLVANNTSSRSVESLPWGISLGRPFPEPIPGTVLTPDTTSYYSSYLQPTNTMPIHICPNRMEGRAYCLHPDKSSRYKICIENRWLIRDCGNGGVCWERDFGVLCRVVKMVA